METLVGIIAAIAMASAIALLVLGINALCWWEAFLPKTKRKVFISACVLGTIVFFSVLWFIWLMHN
jgi:hypothetical protein